MECLMMTAQTFFQGTTHTYGPVGELEDDRTQKNPIYCCPPLLYRFFFCNVTDDGSSFTLLSMEKMVNIDG